MSAPSYVGHPEASRYAAEVTSPDAFPDDPEGFAAAYAAAYASSYANAVEHANPDIREQALDVEHAHGKGYGWAVGLELYREHVRPYGGSSQLRRRS